jgi:hypothetical protein
MKKRKRRSEDTKPSKKQKKETKLPCIEALFSSLGDKDDIFGLKYNKDFSVNDACFCCRRTAGIPGTMCINTKLTITCHNCLKEYNSCFDKYCEEMLEQYVFTTPQNMCIYCVRRKNLKNASVIYGLKTKSELKIFDFDYVKDENDIAIAILEQYNPKGDLYALEIIDKLCQ